MKPKAFKKQTIKLAAHPNTSPADLERFGTAKALVLGNFAVHSNGFYTITHVPSGKIAINRVIEYQHDAKDLARRLDRWFGSADLESETFKNSHAVVRYVQLVRAACNRYERA